MSHERRGRKWVQLQENAIVSSVSFLDCLDNFWCRNFVLSSKMRCCYIRLWCYSRFWRWNMRWGRKWNNKRNNCNNSKMCVSSSPYASTFFESSVTLVSLLFLECCSQERARRFFQDDSKNFFEEKSNKSSLSQRTLDLFSCSSISQNVLRESNPFPVFVICGTFFAVSKIWVLELLKFVSLSC